MLKDDQLKNIIEAALVAAGKPLSIAQLEALFMDNEQPGGKRLRAAIERLEQDYRGRGIAITEVASGFRIQTAPDVAPWVSRLWEERPPRYSRALLETLALIAYRQPITRGEIEEVRGVAVSTNITRTLLDRGWVRVVGHRDVPGRPAMYGTTREFLDYFGLKSLDELPTLSELRDIDSLNKELDLRFPDAAGAAASVAEDEDQLDLLTDTDTDADSDADAVDEGDESIEADRVAQDDPDFPQAADQPDESEDPLPADEQGSSGSGPTDPHMDDPHMDDTDMDDTDMAEPVEADLEAAENPAHETPAEHDPDRNS